MTRKRKTIATAESCTGGLLGALLTETPGASDYYLGGVIAYHNRVKQTLLGVPKRVLLKYGAVSGETAKNMAKNVRKTFGADIGIAITGIAGPSGGTKKKPVGLVYVGMAVRKRTRVKHFLLFGSRGDIRAQAAKNALRWLWRERF